MDMSNSAKIVKMASGWNSPELPGQIFSSRKRLVKALGIEGGIEMGLQEERGPGPGGNASCRKDMEIDDLLDTLRRIATEFTGLHADTGQNDSIGEIYHLLREAGAIQDEDLNQ
jgi:hypothetical protein